MFIRRCHIVGLMIMVIFSGCLLGNPETEDAESNWRLSFSHRSRFVTWDNAIHLNEGAGSASTFTRHRTSLGVTWKPVLNLEIQVKLTNEFRYYFRPEGRDFNLNEVFVDNFYVKWTPSHKLPLVFTLGRQNIILGEGFVVFDPGPMDERTNSLWLVASREQSPGKIADYRLDYPYWGFEEKR